jgi:hypothetical protein
MGDGRRADEIPPEKEKETSRLMEERDTVEMILYICTILILMEKFFARNGTIKGQ